MGTTSGYYLLDLRSLADNVAAVYLQVGVYDRDTQDYWLVGTSNELDSDWNYGLFSDMFSGSWGCIDGASCYVEAVATGDDYVLYRVPVLHNGVQKNLMVALNQVYNEHVPFDQRNYTILGLIATGSEEFGTPEALYEKLKVGDVIEPVLLYNNRYNSGEGTSTVLGNDEVIWNPRNSITVTENTRFYNQSMGPGSYMVMFQIIDFSGTVHYSKPGFYHIDPDGTIRYEFM
jgi:hypothetical protein